MQINKNEKVKSVFFMIKQFGVQLDDSTNPKLKNVAAVSVTAMVEPHQGAGQTLTVTVSSLGDAKSLRGGTLLLTPLRGIDGEVYAIAHLLVVGVVLLGGRQYLAQVIYRSLDR